MSALFERWLLWGWLIMHLGPVLLTRIAAMGSVKSSRDKKQQMSLEYYETVAKRDFYSHTRKKILFILDFPTEQHRIYEIYRCIPIRGARMTELIHVSSKGDTFCQREKNGDFSSAVTSPQFSGRRTHTTLNNNDETDLEKHEKTRRNQSPSSFWLLLWRWRIRRIRLSVFDRYAWRRIIMMYVES